MKKLHAIVAAALLATAPVFAQAVSSGQPANSPILSPTLPANCPPGATNPYDPRCAHPTLPKPVPAPSAPAPSAPPPAGGSGPRLVSGFSGGSTAGMQKVVSYFQRGANRIDTANAFGFVLMPRAAVTEDDRNVQRRFCQVMLASLDYMAPEAASEGKFLMTYWPVSTVVERWQIEYAFKNRRCDDLIDWYDHSLARSIANKAGVAQLSGPMLITWPSQDPEYAEARDPLIVDFARADNEHATKALQYWFRQLNSDPELWTNRIREGTIRAELADAINDTAGVVMAVLHGKWDSVAAVSETP
ncbi:MAG: hypothetical protein HOP13_13615 [Alphaproteobacteria bacterium]|nr:hypothetical protein [Alphaproteobacteria bacterium]